MASPSPTFPAVIPGGDSIGEAMRNARTAIYSHIETLLELGEPADFSALPIERLIADESYAGAV